MASCQRDEMSVPTSLQPNKKICPSMCFMSHEVAEKSLKAGMYATCGVAQHRITSTCTSTNGM